ncbi:MAG: APC family permease [Caulobacteraceae bacterium]|nr:APC family permease [Caulobacteraceae bacterium]
MTPSAPIGRRLIDVFFGRALANSEGEAEKIGWLAGVPAMGLDGLGSASYGPEAALSVLAALGGASFAWIGPIMAPIIALLAVLYLSYRQTIVAYPSNGGAYTVAKENLGRGASLLAATALMIDYVLNVAVGISAGVGALVSSVPALQPYILPLCLAVLAVITLANLRGTGEAGLAFALPTYVFLTTFLGLIAFGLWKVAASGGHPMPVVAPPHLGPGTEALSLWLLIRAFASGCTAMTGVEAVSNGVGAFREPVIKNAHLTLTIICGALGLLLAGIAGVASAYGISAMDQTQAGYQSVLSQLVGAVAGRGPFYFVAMASVLCVLCLSANTSFVGFPRLCRLVANDGFLPRPFAMPDRRLVYSVGIGFLTVTSGLLLIVFGGITDRLIPLFAIGAFLTFTLSQSGMVIHWRRQQGANHARLLVNALGAATTAIALCVILAAKFVSGAWITVLAIPATILLLVRIRRYYDRLDAALAVEGELKVGPIRPPLLIVALQHRSQMSDHAIRFALSLSPDVIAAHLVQLEGPDAQDDGRRLKADWTKNIVQPLVAQGLSPPRLVLLSAPYREIHAPLVEFIRKLESEHTDREIAVLIPELVAEHWWERPLHLGRAERLRAKLIENCDGRLGVIMAPWRPFRGVAKYDATFLG